jgi:hypothetical protein
MPDLDDDAIIVSLPIEDDGVTIEDAGAKKVEPVADDPIADLKSQFSSMTQRATAAETLAQQTAHKLKEVTTELQTTRAAVTDSQLDTVLSGIQAAEAEATAAERDFVAAVEAGDAMAQARAQRKMSAAEVRVQRLTEAKGDLEEAKTAKPIQRTEARTEPRQVQADPIEIAISNAGINTNSKSAAWLRAHPDCVTDDRKNARMMAGHNLAKAEGIPIESDEYFALIEKTVGGTKAEPTPRVEPKVELNGKRPASNAAGGGNVGGGMNGGTYELKITKGQAERSLDGTIVWNYDDPSGKGRFKKGDPIGKQEMARRVDAQRKAGLFDRNYSVES